MANNVFYVIDTSSFVFMEVTYPRSNFPNVWNKSARLINQWRLGAPAVVLTELKRMDKSVVGSLVGWADNHKNRLFYPITNEITRQAGKILKKFPKLISQTSELEKADPYIVAMARELTMNQTLDNREIIVVTQENVTKQAEKNRKIPGVCEFYDLKCIKLLDMIKQERWVFHR
jgi:hypothetical protein